ncbi:hypothetical protein EV359DRAFT_66298 [Lentinula novae-zelandiae]|nr:hypothetical protein EV359DRAFT_66298 [Lentinula novae-zelandiae]
MSLIGFAYTEALIGKEYENKPIRLSSLTLPARRPTHPSIEYLYLLPKLGLESQNPKVRCLLDLYASKSMTKENMSQMPPWQLVPPQIYEAHGEPPVDTTTSESESDSPAPPYTATTDGISLPAMSKRDTDRNRVIFKEHDTVVMRLPRKEFTKSWGLKGECHRTQKDLPKTAADQWNARKDRVLGWPSFLDLVD